MITVPASSYLFLPAPRQFNPAFILDLTELFIARVKFPHRFFNDNVRQKKILLFYAPGDNIWRCYWDND